MTYLSEETGRTELHARPFGAPGRRVQVSQQGASRTWWTPDGRQLLFFDDDQRILWRVDVEAGPVLRIGTPRRISVFPAGIIAIDASPDRQRFLAIAPERTGPGSLTVVQRWAASIRRPD